MANDGMRVWHWTEILQLKNRIDKRMLLKGGMVAEIKTLLKGESPRTIPPEKRLVKFDRDYVVNKLAELISPIKDAPETLIADLLQEALFVLTNNDNKTGVDLNKEELTEEEVDDNGN